MANHKRPSSTGKLSYDRHASIITGKVQLKELQLQMLNVIN